jgi:LuxR family maltose regulon positive regulatory protein
VSNYRAAQALLLDDTSTAVEHAQRALELVDDDEIAHAAASALLGLASWARADLESAHQAYATCSEIFHRSGYHSDVLACAITLGDIRLAQGRLRDAMSTYEQALRLTGQDDAAKPEAVLRGTADMYVGMSAVHRERNDLEAAHRCLQLSQELGEHKGLPQNRYRWRVAMARIREAEGDADAALALLDEAERAYVGDFSPEVRPVPAMQARIWIAQGRLDDAFAWATQRELSAGAQLSYLREFEHVTLARMLVARFARERSEDAATLATGLLERLLLAAEQGGRTGSALEILVLQALTEQWRGDTGAALVPLQRALELAEPEGYALVFLDEGPSMVVLLKAAADQGITPRYVQRLLRADTGDADTASPKAGREGVVEPLSERERDVVRLLATDLGGPDIARELVVSLATVRTHTRNIYAKLGVNNRRAAVRRAEELDLL